MRSSQRIRAELVRSFGGKCSVCGYSRCARALHFHHTDSSEKRDFSHGSGRASTREVSAHPERFVLLCANCHIEAHDRIDAAAKIRRICRNCGEEFTTESKRIETQRGIYCSLRCCHLDRPNMAFGSERERFFRHVQKTPTCWLWTGYATKTTPVLSVLRPDGKRAPMSAARLSYRLHVGEPTKGRKLGKTCGHHLCVNPDHLRIA